MEKDSSYFSSYFESQGISSHVLKILKFTAEQRAFYKIKNVSQEKREYLSKVEEVHKSLSKINFPNTQIVIAGGFPAYVEGITKRFTDIDVFIVSPSPLDLEVRNNYGYTYQSTLYYWLLSPLFRAADVVLGFSPPIEALYCYPDLWLNFKIKLNFYKDSTQLTFNFIFVKCEFAVNWIAAAKLVLSGFDNTFCRVVLSPDFQHIMRFQSPSLLLAKILVVPLFCDLELPRERSRTQRNLVIQRLCIRAEKYFQRIINFGSPLTLFNLAWSSLLKNCTKLSQKSTSLKDILSFSDFSEGDINEEADLSVRICLQSIGYQKCSVEKLTKTACTSAYLKLASL